MAVKFTPGAHPLNNAAEVTDKLVACDGCDDDYLSWKKSSRTGNWYLCDVQKCDRWFTKANPTYRYFQLARSFHRCPRTKKSR